MKRLKLFQKNFLYTFTLILLIVLLIHGLIYTMIPKVYLNSKHKELSHLTQELSNHLDGKDESYVLDFTQKFAYASNANINMSLNQQNFTFFGLMKFDIQLSDELTIEEIEAIQKELFVEAPGVLDKVGVILAQQNFTSRNGLPAKVQVMMSIQPVHEIKAVTIKLLPYSLFLSLVIAALSAYFYSKKMTEPVTELLEITDNMAKFDRKACFISDSEDEISQLGLNINKMYAAL